MDLTCLSFRLKSPIHAPKISVLGVLTQSLGAYRSDPQKALPWTHVVTPHWTDLTHSATCGLGKENEKKKQRQWQTGYSPRPPTSPYRSQSLHAGWPPVCSSIYIKFYWNRSSGFAAVAGRKSPFPITLKSVQWFCRCGWSKIPLSHYFGYWLIQQLVLLYTAYKPWSHGHRARPQVNGRKQSYPSRYTHTL